MSKLSNKSLEKLKGVNSSLVNVIKRAIEITTIDFVVIEGMRTIERQKELVKTKKSQTMRSKHLLGRAIDIGAIVNGIISWDNKYYSEIAKAMKQAAKELGVAIEWGGDWKTLVDAVHFQLKD